MGLGLNDLRFAVRTMRRRPVLSAAIVLPIGLAIAINSALFSVADGLLFRPLPFRSPDELAAIDYTHSGDALPELAYSPRLGAERERLQTELQSCRLIAGAADARATSVLGLPAREAGLQTTAVDSRFFGLLGLAPALGRDFGLDDEADAETISSNASVPAVILSHHVWRQLFGSDPGVLGIRQVAGRPVQVVGVMAPEVKFPGETDIWVAVRSERRPPTYVRMAPGASAQQLSARFPEITAIPLADVNRAKGARTVLVLLAAATLLLLVAWVQVAGLVFSSALARTREIGVRCALGAGTLALIRQFLLESALLAASSLVLASLLVNPLTDFVVQVLPAELTKGQYLYPDWRTFAFAALASSIGLCLLTAIPIAACRRTSPIRLLEGHIGRLAVSVEQLRIGLLIVQISMTVLLLYLAGLMAHSLLKAASFDYGFDSRNVLLFTPPTPVIPTTRAVQGHGMVDARLNEKQRRISDSLDLLNNLPGVVAAASFSSVPLVTRGSRPWTSIPGRPEEHWEAVSAFDGHRVTPELRVTGSMVSQEFISALGATLLAGRGFHDHEYRGREDIIIINEALAKRLVPAAAVDNDIYVSLVGRPIRTTWSTGRIVGVIKNLVYSTPTEPVIPQFFVPAPLAAPFGVLVIRTNQPLPSVLPAIQGVLGRVWGELPPRHFTRLRDAWYHGLAAFQAKALLLAVIAGFCIPLAALGISGALFFSVQLRTRETAIRLALGAEPCQVRWDVVRSALLVAGVSLTFGVGLGVGVGRTLSHHLFQIYPADIPAMLAVAMGTIGLALASALLPARHASSLDPATALRAE